MSKLNRLGKRGPPLSINADLMALADSLNQDGASQAEGNLRSLQIQLSFNLFPKLAEFNAHYQLINFWTCSVDYKLKHTSLSQDSLV